MATAFEPQPDSIYPTPSRYGEDDILLRAREEDAISAKVRRLQALYGMNGHTNHLFTETGIQKICDNIITQGNERKLRVGDVGSGTGDGSKVIALNALLQGVDVQMYYVDQYPALIEEAQAGIHSLAEPEGLESHLTSEGIPLLIGEDGKLPFDDDSLDVLVLSRFLHEHPEETQVSLLEECKRVLGDQGRLVLLTNLIEDPRRGQGESSFESFFNRLITLKDNLAGVYSRHPYFASQGKIMSMLAVAGFEKMDIVSRWERKWNTLHRYFEIQWEPAFLNILNNMIDINSGIAKSEVALPLTRDEAYKVFGEELSELKYQRIKNSEGRVFTIPTGIIAASVGHKGKFFY